MNILHIIMPVSLDPLFEAKILILKNIAVQHNVLIRYPRVTEEPSNFDLGLLLNQFQAAAIIIADLSFERPSCYYELGIAEALKTDIRLIATTNTKIHQTSKKSQVYFYNDLECYQEYFDIAVGSM